MITILMSLIVGCIYPALLLSIDNHEESNEEQRSCYVFLVILGTCYIVFFGNKWSLISWILLALIVILLIINFKNPTALGNMLKTFKSIIPTYMNALHRLEFAEESTCILSSLLDKIVKTNVVLTALSLTPIIGKRQVFCIVLGSLVYLIVVHILLVKNDLILQSLANIRKVIRYKLGILRERDDIDENDYAPVDMEDDTSDEYNDEGEEDEFTLRKPKSTKHSLTKMVTPSTSSTSRLKPLQPTTSKGVSLAKINAPSSISPSKGVGSLNPLNRPVQSQVNNNSDMDNDYDSLLTKSPTDTKLEADIMGTKQYIPPRTSITPIKPQMNSGQNKTVQPTIEPRRRKL